MLESRIETFLGEDGIVGQEDMQDAERSQDGSLYVFRLGRTSYRRTRLLGWLLLSAFLLCAIVSIVLSIHLLPTYPHTFVPYLRWQDILAVTCWYIALISLGGCILVVRFLYALHAGYSKGMLTLIGKRTLVARDLSHKNLASIFWAVGTAFSCFIGMVVGLVPEMLIGWTLSLPHPALMIFATGAAIALSVAGLAVTLPATSFIFIGIIGCISFCKKLGAAHIYQLTQQTTLRIDSRVLTIIYPDTPESMIDLNSLEAKDQRYLLFLLHKRWIDAQRSWNPSLGEEIEAALRPE